MFLILMFFTVISNIIDIQPRSQALSLLLEDVLPPDFHWIYIYNGLCNGYRTLPLSVAFVIYRSAFTSRSAFGAGLDSDQAIRA